MRSFLLIVVLMVGRGVLAQTDPSLTLSEFYQMVTQYHPLAQQAELLMVSGEQVVKQARGAFDPKLVSSYQSKSFDGKVYFDVWNSYVKVPTLLNVDLKAGYERNSGTYLNPERTVPTDGLYYAGVSVPVGQGLIRNQRRIDLQKGQFEQENLSNQARRVLNNLLLDANIAYWWWFENYEKAEVARTSLQLINERYEGLREAALNGENAPIDSVEMLIQVQQWTNNLRKAELELSNSILLISNFIWTDSLAPATLKPINETDTHGLLDGYLDEAIVSHPDLKELDIQREVLELDRKMNAEMLKPIIDLNYNALIAGGSGSEWGGFANDYKWGIDFAFPLLLRKERAKLKLVKIKQAGTDLKIHQKNREILTKIQQNWNKVYTLDEMINQQQVILTNYTTMLEAERTKFENGESSVFLLNSRANKRLEGEIKLIELKAQYARAIGQLKWSAGALPQEMD